MKKLMKNKFVVLVFCIILVSCAYFGIEKLINEYEFHSNSGFEDDVLLDEDDGKRVGMEYKGSAEPFESGEASSVLAEDEVDLVLEDSEECKEEDMVGPVDENNGEMLGDASGTGDDMGKIYVYITGEVNVPGGVILNEGSRIVDAINAAGGTTNKANISKVNLVYILDDGMKVNIPNSNDLKNNPNFEYITMSSGDGASDEVYGSDYGSTENGTGTGSESLGRGFSSYGYSIVNINTASQTELESLPGIGPSLALKIINYRKENGKFSSIDQIKNVSGIGDSRFEDLKSYITVK